MPTRQRQRALRHAKGGPSLTCGQLACAGAGLQALLASLLFIVHSVQGGALPTRQGQAALRHAEGERPLRKIGVCFVNAPAWISVARGPHFTQSLGGSPCRAVVTPTRTRRTRSDGRGELIRCRKQHIRRKCASSLRSAFTTMLGRSLRGLKVGLFGSQSIIPRLLPYCLARVLSNWALILFNLALAGRRGLTVFNLALAGRRGSGRLHGREGKEGDSRVRVVRVGQTDH